MNIRFLFILSLCVWSSLFYSQEKVNDKASFREKFEAANSLMEDNLFEFAKEIWLELNDKYFHLLTIFHRLTFDSAAHC